VQEGAGVGSGFSDDMYKSAGATIGSVGEVWKQNMVLKIEAPSSEELKLVENRSVLSMLGSRNNQEAVDQLADQEATAFDLTMLLRTLSRGQAFDVLSSQANIAGYRAVLEVGDRENMFLDKYVFLVLVNCYPN
jgi:H+-translocating NAD(P) transhydrogenase